VECVCGCGTEIPKRLIPTNLVASMLMLELAEWDRFRFNAAKAGLDGFDVDALDGFIEDGGLCFQRSLLVLHGIALHSNPRDTKRWLKYSRKSRKGLAKNFGVIAGEKQVPLDDEHAAHLNREHPEWSYTGQPEAADSFYDPELEAELDEATESAEQLPAGDVDDEGDDDAGDVDGGGTTLAELERKYLGPEGDA
jgi:hypothetical protein